MQPRFAISQRHSFALQYKNGAVASLSWNGKEIDNGIADHDSILQALNWAMIFKQASTFQQREHAMLMVASDKARMRHMRAWMQIIHCSSEWFDGRLLFSACTT